MTDRFSFVIPALNEEACLADCIRSIQSQGPDQAVEIIVADNGSTDRTIEIARQLGCVITHEVQPGLSHARNAGAAAAQGDILCFIDADGVLASTWLPAARRCFSQGTIGAVSGLSIYTHPRLWKRLYYNLYPLLTSGGAFLSSLIFSRMIFAGNNFAIRRNLFFEIGGYEPVIGEGMWLSRRFWKLAGYQGKLCPGMLLWNSSRGFDQLGFARTLSYWVRSSLTRRTQIGYTYKSR